AAGASNASDATLHQPPVRTRTWFHTGAFIDGADLLRQFGNDYFQNPVVPEHALPEPQLPAWLSPEERRQAARACKGMMLRQEIYADDGSLQQAFPFSTAEHNCNIRVLQPMLGNRYAVFLTHESEALTYSYERDPSDPRISHTLNTAIDEIGNVIETAEGTYGRPAPDATLPPEVHNDQTRLHVTS